MLEFALMEAQAPIAQRLRRHYLFAGLEQGAFDGLVSHAQLVQVPRKEVLFHRGDPADSFYYVLSGQIELGFVAPNGEKKILEVFGPGRTFAEAVTFMRRQVYPATAQAVDNAQVVRIPSGAYVSLLYDNPDACMRLLADISQHLHARVIEVERSTVQNAKSRFTAFLLDKVDSQGEDHTTLSLSMPKHVLASRLSIKPETLSRILKVMSNEQLIIAKDSIIEIPSVNRLQASLYAPSH